MVITKLYHKIRKDSDPGAELRRTSFLYSILGELARVGQKSDNSVPILRAIGIMENYYNTDLDIEGIADSAVKQAKPRLNTDEVCRKNNVFSINKIR